MTLECTTVTELEAGSSSARRTEDEATRSSDVEVVVAGRNCGGLGRIFRQCGERAIISVRLENELGEEMVGTQPEGWSKLNVDGSCLDNGNTIAAVGIIRDNNGSWLSGYAQFIGVGCSIQAELWSLYLGLRRAKDMGIQLLEVESDCQGVVEFMLCDNISNTHLLALLILSCRSFLPQFNQCVVRHIYREKNSCTDCLAKFAAAHKLPFTIYHVVPSYLKSVFWADLFGICGTRRISIPLETG
ncbi:putative ribonuclease H-like domain-containing protein [Senna tora]|uniref:Putative ribonuclease H-like domain-containing protein n=1 Tax=Senna tora TaxID=362788 RepID=A0A834XDU6_9FABA|nr:putative ribonuclease H-like domain-containing protein [Senna tora]